MSDLSIDFDELVRARDGIRTTAETLRAAQLAGDEIADLTAHPRLAGKVREFAGNWDRRRGELLKALQHLDDGIRSIDETLADVDSRLATQLQEATAQGGAR